MGTVETASLLALLTFVLGIIKSFLFFYHTRIVIRELVEYKLTTLL